MTELLARLAESGAEYYRRGWMLATAGNLSVRDPENDGRYFVTASGGHKGRLRADKDFLRFELGMQNPVPAGVKSSAETIVHDLIYALLPNAKSIHHVHSPHVTLVSRMIGGGATWEIKDFEYIKALGFWGEGDVVKVPVVTNHHDIPALGRAVEEAAQRDVRVPAVLVDGHGVYAWGDSIDAAQRHIEAIEFLADMTWEERFRQRDRTDFF